MKTKYDRMYSITGFVCSLLGFVTCGLTSVVGLIFSCLGLSQSKKNIGKKDGLAVAGIIISIPSLIIFILIIIVGIIDEINAVDVTVIDFSSVTGEEAEKWCESNEVNCHFKKEYSDTVPRGQFIRQEIETGKVIKSNGSINLYYSKGANPNKIKKKKEEKSKPKTVKIILETKEINIGSGESMTINYKVEPSDNIIKKIEWETENSRIATVEDGVITGIQAGKTVITVKINDKSEKIIVNVTRTYEKANIDDMEAALDNNAAAAKDYYKNRYIEVTGRLGVIDSDLKYIGLYSMNDKWDFTGIYCRIKNTETREMVKTLSIDQTITIRGKITDAGEILGYYMNIDEIIPQ